MGGKIKLASFFFMFLILLGLTPLYQFEFWDISLQNSHYQSQLFLLSKDFAFNYQYVD
ncbi:unnamed protein product [Paramecium pentaurelia]|uniref:Uncharacterized protein n=1 Tax=Paramecium pentaurelia TaxID=43138 RepID=A0A8S1YKU8_9CILI|nr:unnamed protein product [Paramecium pentaurelia]